MYRGQQGENEQGDGPGNETGDAQGEEPKDGLWDEPGQPVQLTANNVGNKLASSTQRFTPKSDFKSMNCLPARLPAFPACL